MLDYVVGMLALIYTVNMDISLGCEGTDLQYQKHMSISFTNLFNVEVTVVVIWILKFNQQF